MSELIHIGRQNMSEISMYIRHCMLNEFQLENNASAAAGHICAALGEGAVADRTCQNWFKRHGEGGTSLENRPRSERPPESDTERIKVLIGGNPPLITCESSAVPRCNQSTIDCHLHDIGKVNQLGT